MEKLLQVEHLSVTFDGPAGTVEALFHLLPGTKQYTYLQTQVHTHSRASMVLFAAWLRMYA